MHENEYLLTIIKITRHHIFFNMSVNGSLANTDGYICLPKEGSSDLRPVFPGSVPFIQRPLHKELQQQPAYRILFLNDAFLMTSV